VYIDECKQFPPMRMPWVLSSFPRSPLSRTNRLCSEQVGRMGQEMEKSRRGFAAMDPEKQRAIASKGGRTAHELVRAHEFTIEEARAAGRKGTGRKRRRNPGLAVAG